MSTSPATPQNITKIHRNQSFSRCNYKFERIKHAPLALSMLLVSVVKFFVSLSFYLVSLWSLGFNLCSFEPNLLNLRPKEGRPPFITLLTPPQLICELCSMRPPSPSRQSFLAPSKMMLPPLRLLLSLCLRCFEHDEGVDPYNSKSVSLLVLKSPPLAADSWHFIESRRVFHFWNMKLLRTIDASNWNLCSCCNFATSKEHFQLRKKGTCKYRTIWVCQIEKKIKASYMIFVGLGTLIPIQQFEHRSHGIYCIPLVYGSTYVT